MALVRFQAAAAMRLPLIAMLCGLAAAAALLALRGGDEQQEAVRGCHDWPRGSRGHNTVIVENPSWSGFEIHPAAEGIG